MRASSEFLFNRRGRRASHGKSVTPWPPARSRHWQTVLFSGALGIACFAATVGALTQESERTPRPRSVMAISRAAIEATVAVAPAPVMVAETHPHVVDTCGDFDILFLNSQCLKFHPRRQVRPHRVATWIIAHPAQPTPQPVAVTPSAPPGQQTAATHNPVERHVKKTAARTEPSAMPPRRRADLDLADRAYE